MKKWLDSGLKWNNKFVSRHFSYPLTISNLQNPYGSVMSMDDNPVSLARLLEIVENFGDLLPGDREACIALIMKAI